MMDIINSLIDSYNIPILTAFLLGMLSSISPCPLATNITAIAFISREIKTAKNTLLNGFVYTLGRGVSYTLLATLIYFGFSVFQVARIFQGWGEKFLGPVLILIGLVMLGIFKFNFIKSGDKAEKAKIWLSHQGIIGSFLLGMLFALAFCPYSGVLFFGVLIPLVLKSSEGLLLPPIFALGTGFPVMLFSFLLAFSVQKIGKVFQIMQKMENIMRNGVAVTFLGVGIYYMQYFIIYLGSR